ncbi:MAG: dTDP-4-dehydrorhamnose reductase [Caldilineales bacterium]|nr:dTDP-4-dehydrorhamnose reductase [Caldilineales bacterium]MDW8316785.1 dTDP-4-dehydrorhamnose reductase [Anaerolineae bacterium]
MTAQRIVVVGARGQLGRALLAALSSHTLLPLARPEADVADPSIADRVVELRPDVVINAAAWTDVDGAEDHPDACYAANVLGAVYLAQACGRIGAALVQISTNEVFPGEPGQLYREWDPPQPRSGAYAASKAAAERAALSLTGGRCYVVRTAWVYHRGGNNFVTKIIAAADRYGSLRVVADEFGNPTYAPDLAAAIARLIATERYGIYHLTNSGFCSRYQWAVEILRLAGREHVPVTPIGLADWPRRTRPPAHAVLLNTAAAALGIALRPWQEGLRAYFGEQ